MVTINKEQYKVIGNLGLQHSIGMYAKIVETPTGGRVVVKKEGSNWRFWNPEDKLKLKRSESERS